MKNIGSVIFLCFLIGFICVSVEANTLKIVPCKSVGKPIATLKKIEITDCKAYPCVFKRGTKYSIKAEFQTQQKLTDLKLNIMGQINNKNVPFSTNDENHCTETIKEVKDSKKCVLNRKGTYNYEFSLDVLKSYPALHVYVNYMVKSNDKPVFCFTFPARLV
jgi:hypothetical protein